MRRLVLFFISYWITFYSFAQDPLKPPLGEGDLGTWPRVEPVAMSSDGHYVSYSTELLNGTGANPLYLRSTQDEFRKKIPFGGVSHFTDDNHFFLYQTHDSLGIMDLSSRTERFITGVSAFDMPRKRGGASVVVYRTTAGELVLLNWATGASRDFEGVDRYARSPRDNVLLIFQPAGEGVRISRLDLRNGRCEEVWKGKSIVGYAFDSAEDKLALETSEDDDGRHGRIWEVDSRQDSAARLVVCGKSAGIEPEYSVGPILEYSPDGRQLFFGMYYWADSLTAPASAVQVDIWNYQDASLQCDQLPAVARERDRTYLSVVDLKSGKVMRVEQCRDDPGALKLNQGNNDRHLLTLTRVNRTEMEINLEQWPDGWLTDTRTGERLRVFQQKEKVAYAGFSPGGKYVTWTDRGHLFYFYNIVERKRYVMNPKLLSTTAGTDGYEGQWLEGDRGMLLYDRYDIWQVDPEGKTPPVNITQGYGQRHKIKLRVIETVDGETHPLRDPITPGEQLTLCGFNDVTKDNGFFRIILGKLVAPELLHMGPYAYYFNQGLSSTIHLPDFLMKARDTAMYLLFKERAEDCPNLVVTGNFRTFRPVSDVAPEKKVNWLTSELVTWITFDGRVGHGILYKPADFDPGRKYPVIFYFYEQLSGRLHQYFYPEWTEGHMNIPWFVSHGYLVFTPDIEYTLGDPGIGIYNYVVSAAKMLQKKPFVDGRHMGIQGHSFGGFEVNYLVTRTGIFAAASEGAGATDFISSSGEAGLGTGTGQGFTEFGQLRMKVPFWRNLAGYIANSPIFGSGRVTTPLLMMHCQKDGAVPWQQAVEFFTALRRQGKSCYLLQYDEGNHTLSGQDAMDYTRRMTQFFDHYLKGAAMPKWMSEGIPARLKGIDDGLELISPNTK